MKTILSVQRPLVPASHEDPREPGAWKKVLFERADFQAGAVQMVNWARLPAGKGFAAHYHEDMQEVFVIISGTAELTAGPNTVVLHRGDAVLIDVREVHQMRAQGDEDLEYLVVGISAGEGGRTVVVEAT
jgi:mannose-6-phosphate isomerase-like protein (cupin superfamily)